MKYRDAWVIGPNGGLVAAWVVVDDGLAVDAKDDLVWITAHPNGPDAKGRHIPLDKNGIIQGGMGGKFNGQHIALIPRKRQWQPNKTDVKKGLKPRVQRYKGIFGQSPSGSAGMNLPNPSSVTSHKTLDDWSKKVGYDFTQYGVSLQLDQDIRKKYNDLTAEVEDVLDKKQADKYEQYEAHERLLRHIDKMYKYGAKLENILTNKPRSIKYKRFYGGKYKAAEYALTGIARQLTERAKEDMRPAQLAGVSRGPEMSHSEADTNKPNPNYAKNKSYTINCQSCVVAYEARRRGYDVMALPNKQFKSKLGIDGAKGAMAVSINPEIAFYDPNTGFPPYPEPLTCASPSELLKFLKQDSNMERGARYHLILCWKKGNAHITTVHKSQTGDLSLYDPQTGEEWNGDAEILNNSYLNEAVFSTQIGHLNPKIYRVDNLCFNPQACGDILEEMGKN